MENKKEITRIYIIALLFLGFVSWNSTSLHAKGIEVSAVLDTLDDRFLLLQEVQELKTSNNIDTAQNFLEDAVNQFEEWNDDFGRATALKVLGYVEIKQKYYSSSFEHLKFATSLFTQLGETEPVAECLYYKALLHFNQRKFVEAITIGKEGLRFCEETDCMEQGLLLELLFSANASLEHIDDAEKYAKKAIKHYKKKNQPIKEAATYLQLAEVYQLLEYYPRAFEFYTLALNTYQQQNSLLKACEVNYRIGKHYNTQEDYAQAMEQLALSEDCAKNLKSKKLEANVLRAKGHALHELQNYKESIKIFKRSARLRRGLGDKKGHAADLILLGKSHQADSNPKRAIKQFERSVEVSQSIYDQNGLLQAYGSIARVHLEEDQLEDATSYADHALDILSEITNLGAIKETYDLVAEIYERRGEQSEAQKFAAKAKAIEDSLRALAAVKERRLISLREELEQANYRIEIIQKENTRRSKRVQEQAKELASKDALIESQAEIAQNRSRYITALSIGVLLSMLILGLVAFNSIQRQRANKELQAVNQELQSANSELEESQARLQHFAYSVAHDLKNPMNSIAGFSSLLEISAGEKLSLEERDYLENINSSSLAISKMINDLQEYATIGSDLQAAESIHLENLILDVQRDLSQIIREKKASLEIHQLPTIEAHPTMIRQLFQNLVSNAIKYSRPDVRPNIEIATETIEEETVFLVRDNGIGIPEKAQSEIFELFNRVNQKEQEGSGIGLALCKRIIELYGGRIWLESQKDEGSTFFFTLPNALKD